MIKAIKESELHPKSDPVHSEGRWYIFCPGCYEQAKNEYPDEPRYWLNYALHCFSEKIHQFNGNVESPTLSPSLMVKGGKSICHSYVNDGKIQFLGDCTHPLANQTHELMDSALYLEQQRNKTP